MKLSLIHRSKNYYFESEQGFNISIPLDFTGEQPNAFGVPYAVSEAVISGPFIGDTRLGGSCNFEQINFIPHCNGTHTECIGHITNERIYISDININSINTAILITVEPVVSESINETYIPGAGKTDMLITAENIKEKIEYIFGFEPSALIIRTLPNDKSKLKKNYSDINPPFFTIEAMQYISENKIKHLLVDLPSVDRKSDDGKLTAHRTFWNIPFGSKEKNKDTRIQNTITELIYVPDEVEDGQYLLDLQVANFRSDASPSKPIIYKLYENTKS